MSERDGSFSGSSTKGHNSLGWAKPKPEASNSIEVHLSGRVPNIEVIILSCFSGELDRKELRLKPVFHEMLAL